jgi:hypothetical protein
VYEACPSAVGVGVRGRRGHVRIAVRAVAISVKAVKHTTSRGTGRKSENLERWPQSESRGRGRTHLTAAPEYASVISSLPIAAASAP